jgi:ATP-binding cassette subfamily B protein
VQQFDWRVRETEHFVFHYLPDSYAADHLPWIAGRAERAWRELRAFVGDGTPAPPKIRVYLLLLLPHPEQPGEQLARGAYADPNTGEIWAVCRPESPAEGLEESIGRLLVFQHYAPEAGEVPFMRAGLVAYVMAHAGKTPAPERLHRATSEKIGKGEPVAFFPWLVERSAVDQRDYTGLALSFFTYLVDQYGIAALQGFLAHYTLQNPDAAATTAYKKPVPGLYEEWMGTASRFAGSKVSIGEFFQRLMPYLKPYPIPIFLILVYLLFSVGFQTAMALVLQPIVDNVINGGNLELLKNFMIVLFVLFLIMGLTSLHRSYLTAWVSEKMLIRLRLDVFDQLLRLSASYYSRARVGDIVSRLSNDLVVVQQAISQAALTGLTYVLSFVIGVFFLFRLDVRLAAVVMITLPLIFLSSLLLSERVVKASLDRSERMGDVTDVLQESLNAQAVVRAFGLQNTVLGNFARTLDRLFDSMIRLVFLGSLWGLSGTLISSLIQLLVIGIGAYLIIIGEFTTGALLAFLSLMGQVTSPVQQALQLLQQLQQAGGSMQRVAQILDERIEVQDAPDAVELAPMQRELQFEGVWFSYTGAQPTLQDMSFAVAAGSHVAVVGPSGAGKSSVINLIMRFFDPQQGRVTIDGVDIRAVTQASLRQQMGVVFQDTFLFNTSIRENLRYGRLNATDDEIIAAARQAEIHDFIMSLPSGYDTTAGERGARLSGGQRQRLAIARALLRNPKLLLLDEATSALDAETEAQIQATLNQVNEQLKLTTIAVTHRLASAAHADRILVLDRGVLVEQGTHAELMAARGLYARLYEEQMGALAAGVEPTVQASRLQRVPLFADLPPETLAAVSSRLEMERFADGDTIIRQGDIGDKLYLIDRGQVEVLAHDSTTDDHPLNTLHEGDYFGEIALLLDVPRTATVRALGAVQLLALTKADFRTLVERLPGFADRMGPTVQGRLAQQREQLSAPSPG